MNNNVARFCMFCFHERLVASGRVRHALPIALQGFNGYVGSPVVPITVVAPGISVPNSRGGPPIQEE